MKVVDRLNRWFACVVILLLGVRAIAGEIHHHCAADQHCIICSALPTGRRVSAPQGRELRHLRAGIVDPSIKQRRSILIHRSGAKRLRIDRARVAVPEYRAPAFDEPRKACSSRGPPRLS